MQDLLVPFFPPLYLKFSSGDNFAWRDTGIWPWLSQLQERGSECSLNLKILVNTLHGVWDRFPSQRLQRPQTSIVSRLRICLSLIYHLVTVTKVSDIDKLREERFDGSSFKRFFSSRGERHDIADHLCHCKQGSREENQALFWFPPS